MRKDRKIKKTEELLQRQQPPWGEGKGKGKGALTELAGSELKKYFMLESPARGTSSFYVCVFLNFYYLKTTAEQNNNIN